MKKNLVLLAGLFAAAVGAHAQSATYALDPTHTTVFFEAKHFGTSTNRGRWDKKEGTIVYDKTAKTGKVDVTLDMNSISTGIGPFDGHLPDAADVRERRHVRRDGCNVGHDGERAQRRRLPL